MKISIITSTYNSLSTVQSSLDSFASQTYKNKEHVFIDGASKDGTKELLQGYCQKHENSILVSEPDKGIYDALNKGVANSTGDIIGICHSDDFFADEQVLSKVANAFGDKYIQAVYGDLQYVSKNNPENVVRNWVSGDYKLSLLKKGWMPPHPAFFVKKELYEKFGNFDLSYKIAADYDLMMRFLGVHGIVPGYIPEVLCKMRVGGESNRSLKNIWRKSCEDYRVMKSNGIGGLGTLFMKNFSKIGQFVKKG